MTTYGTAVYNGTTYTLYGFPGSTLRDELNRLANGGEYPSLLAYKDETGAANEWCGTEPGLGMTAALNFKADSTRPPVDYKANNAVANELAGMTFSPNQYVEIVTALRTIAS
jgi:hypothetical protein